MFSLFSYPFLMISLLIVILLTPAREELLNNNFIIIMSTIALFNVISFFRTLTLYYKTWIRFDVLFLLGYLIVHFQIAFFYSAFGIKPADNNFWVNIFVVNYAIWLSTIVLLLWMLGFYTYISLKKNKKVVQPKEYYIRKNKNFDLYLVLSFILFVGLVGQNFWSGNHAGLSNWNAGATYAFLIFRTILFLAVIYFFVNNKGKLVSMSSLGNALFQNRLLVVICIIYTLSFLLQGDRGPVMQFGLMILGCYSIFQNNFSFKKVLVITLSGAFVFTLIGLGRTNDVTSRQGNIFSAGMESFQENEDIVSPTDELAKSATILFTALDVVPDKHPYLNGATVFNNLVEVVPMSSLFYNPPKIYQSSTSFFTYLIYGEYPNWGVGSEVIADLYVNFGVFITLAIFFVFGYYLSYLTFESHINKNYMNILVYLMILMLAIYINRSIFLNPLKFIFYLLIFNALLGKKIYVKT